MLKIAKVIMFSFIFMICVSGCGKSEVVPNTDSFPGFVSKCALKDGTDEWLYLFCIEYLKLDSSSKDVKNNYDSSTNANSYIFDGFNLKYKQLENYYIPVVNVLTGEEVDSVTPPLPSLSVSSKLRDEVEKINKFFATKKFTSNITLEDLKSLNIQYIDKNLLLDLYNDAYSKEPIELGKWLELPQATIVVSDKLENLNYKYNVGYFIDYGNIKKVNIDLLYDDGKYLSDLVKEKSASEEDVKKYNELQEIENFIIKNQTFDISNYKNYNFDDYNQLKEYLKQIS